MSANSEENDAKMQGSEDEQEEEAVIELKPLWLAGCGYRH